MKWALLAIVLGTLLRCAHLLSDNHPVLSADSYYFLHYAQSVARGVDPQFSIEPGLAHVVGYLAKVIGIQSAWCVVPLAISAIMTISLYVFAGHFFGRTAGICAAFTWATVPQAIYITSTGYLDRDGFCVLLVAMAAMVVYWTIRKPTLWVVLIGFVVIGAISQILVILWAWVGLYIVLASCYAVIIIDYIRAGKMKSWAVLYILSIVPIVAIALNTENLSHIWTIAARTRHDIPMIEMGGMTIIDAFLYWNPILIMVILLGIWYGIKDKRNIWSILVWAGMFVFIAFFVRRVAVFALPAVCILGGVGGLYVNKALKALIAEFPGKTIGALIGVCLIAILMVFAWGSYLHGTIDHLTPSPDWQVGLKYLRNNARNDQRIMCHPNYGYWVMALADKKPLARGSTMGGYEYLGPAYCADSGQELSAIISASGCDYMIASLLEYDGGIQKHFYRRYCPDCNQDDTVLYQILNGEKVEGITIVYRNTRVAVVATGWHKEKGVIK